LLIGAGPQGLTTSPIATLAQARRPETHVYGLGSDVLFDCVLAPEPIPNRVPLPARHTAANLCG